MKKLGLIGGIGPESTITYYNDIVYGVQSKVGKKFFPNLTIESLNVFDVLNMCDSKEYEALTN
jgi:aspartate racemase